jgi:hypothetical protein
MGNCVKKGVEVSVDTVGKVHELLQSDIGQAAIQVVELIAEKSKYRNSSQRTIDALAQKIIEAKHIDDISASTEEIKNSQENK